MRYSNTSVEQFHLGRLVDGIDTGIIGIPEFQRDFDWNENDIRSLLATVFSGWPAGSLLLLEGEQQLFQLRPMEAAPALEVVQYAVLDGQQRLTSLYQALYGRGSTVFAIEWDLGADQEIEECIVSIRRRTWERDYASIQQQLDKRIIPVGALKSPTEFFTWRDNLLGSVEDLERREQLRALITDLYTYRLSAIHGYEFPVVKIDRRVEPSAISRIFEKVNKTGLTLNTFDLMVAKSFDAGWNLRDRWLSAREEFLELSGFFGEDGLPLLQAIALICKNDLRQAAVLELSKQQVQTHWDDAAAAAARVVRFLRRNCGVIRRDFMPYANLLPPLIALEKRGSVSDDNGLFELWFWTAGFVGIYDAAANTRLVSHYKSVSEGNRRGFEISEQRVIGLSGVTRKTQKALWTTMMCANIREMENRRGIELPEALIAELEVSNLYSRDEIESSFHWEDDSELDNEFRSSLNSIIIPRRLASIARKLSASETMSLCQNSEFAEFATGQIEMFALGKPESWDVFREKRAQSIYSFIQDRGVTGIDVGIPIAGEHDLVQFLAL